MANMLISGPILLQINSFYVTRMQHWVSYFHIDGLVQERRTSSALAMGLRLSCINASILGYLCFHWGIFVFIACHD